MQCVYEQKSQCYGCTACKNICPRDAIGMQQDEEGFEYPNIDSAKCVDCKLCVKVCPYHSAHSEVEEFEQMYYAVQHLDKNIVSESSSGGMFSALAEEVVKANGVVYGATFDEAFEVKHDRAVTREQYHSFVGSKYIQSSMGEIMSNIVADLTEERIVMFTGTPCQVAGVREFVLHKRKTLQGLLLCDFVCHGAASPVVWRDYVQYLNDKHKEGVTFYHFRGKKDGWHQWKPILRIGNQDISAEYVKKNSFLLIYQTCYINRPSCYSCQFTSYNRVADMTLGDFWNIGSVCPDMDDNTGTSQVIVNTAIGKEWFERCKDKIRYHQCGKQDVWQPHLEYPTNVSAQKRSDFWKNYTIESFEYVLKKYGSGNVMAKIKNIAVPIAKKTGLYVIAGKIYRIIFVKR